MGFQGVYRALYDYAPGAEGELAIAEGDLLFVLDKNGDDGWWTAKKKAGADDEDEPEGLVPNNYVEEAPPLTEARSLFEYTRQTAEELSFPEDATLRVFDVSDPDWILVGLDDDYGFVPSNYIEMQEAGGDDDDAMASPVAPPSLPARPRAATADSNVSSPSSPAPSGPASALAGIMQGRSMPQDDSPPPQPPRQSIAYDPPSDEEPVRSPQLPTRPRPAPEPSYDDPSPPAANTYRSPGGFHMYNINEMVSVMGKRKKMPTTLGINLGTAVILIAPERAQDGPSQEWTADRMTHYSREGKHVFMELVRPSKSVDFHAGAKDTAEEIVAALGEMAGAVRAEGLREVIMAGSNQSQLKGHIVYDFMAQGDDEVTVATGDEVVVIDNSKSEEWWQVRRLKNGKEGVVPSSYIEVTGTVTPPPSSAGLNSAHSTVEKNRAEELRLTKEALKASKDPQQVGPGMPLPERGSSLTASTNGNHSRQERSRHDGGRGEGSGQSRSKSKPDSSKVRTWTDRSRSFSVDAQFLGLKDSKIHLHKLNGVKIAVPIAKMSRDDLEYVENLTGVSLDDEKPLADMKRPRQSGKASPPASGASVVKKDEPSYDWFQFFLSCDVAVGLCERYAQAFIKDSMDESVLPDVDANILRTLGLREGDIIKVMRSLDAKFGRDRQSKQNGPQEAQDGEGGLFSGPGGALRNNTRKGRPAPAVQTNDIVDAKTLLKKDENSAPEAENKSKSPAPTSPVNNNDPPRASSSGFDDDAWDVKPSKQQSSPPQPKRGTTTSVASTPAPISQGLTGSMKDLSLLTAPLQPTKTEPQPPAAINNVQPQAQQQSLSSPQQQMPGATPSFFSTVAQARQRPPPPQASPPAQGSLVPPPPQRPLSAPQSAQPSAFAAPSLAPQITGSVQSRVAPPGQSLEEINQSRLQQQYLAQMQAQQPAYSGYAGNQQTPLVPYPTGAPGQFMQPMVTGGPAVGAGPFADPNRPHQYQPMQATPTGFQQGFANVQQTGFGQPPPGGINNYLPPALDPQRTGMPSMQPQATGVGTFSPPPPPAQPLQPQKTGPAPPVRFGVSNETKKLAPQPTGRKANLAQATPQNPFGF